MTFTKITRQIEKKNGWEKLVAQPEPAIVPMVREFYANAIEHHDYRIVMGKQVPFDKTIISQYFGVSNIDNDEYLIAINDCDFD